MTIDLRNLSETAILGAIALVGLFVLILPIALKLAGLTGQQIADLLSLTLQFFINLMKEFRAQNNKP
jgi:hypothetical protein